MVAGKDRSRWVSTIYLGVAALVVAVIVLAAWFGGSRIPELQAKRWGSVQLQAIRQSRDQLQDRLSQLEYRIRLLADAPLWRRGPVDAEQARREVERSFVGLEIEGLHVQCFDSTGQLVSQVKPSFQETNLDLSDTPKQTEEILAWIEQPEHQGRVRRTLQQVDEEGASDTRVFAEFVTGIGIDDSHDGFLAVRFPVKSLFASDLLAARLLPTSYTFVIERARTAGDLSIPGSILWHFRNPRWADAYLSDTATFVQSLLRLFPDAKDESYVIAPIPLGDGETRREIVSVIPVSFGEHRWIVGLSTPYSEAVFSTREQQSFMILVGALTLALLATGLLLLRYQRTQIEQEADRERRNELERIGHHYRELFAENPAAMIVLEGDGRIVRCNYSAERLLGVAEQQALGAHLSDFFEANSVELVWERLSAQAHLASMDARFVRKLDHKGTLVEVSGRRIGDQYILLVQDVEQRRDLDRQLARLRRMESVGSLASTLAHDFNNILGQVQILVSSLRSDVEANSSVHQDLGAIEEKIEDASQLVGNLLSFRENVMTDEAIYPEPVLRDFATQLRRLVPENVELVTEVRPDLPSIWLTPTSLRRMLDNLVRNAVDAMPQGGTLTIRARSKRVDAREATAQLAAGDYCVIEVIDTGVGMSQETLDAIFDPYFTTKTEGKGTGLGLWTIYKILRRTRGAVHVKSKPGQGTEFMLYLAHSRPVEDIDTPGLELARPRR